MTQVPRLLVVQHSDHFSRVDGLAQAKLEDVNVGLNGASCVSQTLSNKIRRTHAVDFTGDARILKSWNGNGGAFNSTSKIVIIDAGDGVVNAYDIESGHRLYTQTFVEEVDFIRWISSRVVAIVTRGFVWHWEVSRSRANPPVEWFERDPAIRNTIIVDYRTVRDGEWCVLMANDKPSPVSAGRAAIPIEGIAQLYSREANLSSIIEAHSMELVEVDLFGYPRNMVLGLMAKRTVMSSELRIMELKATGESTFANKAANINFTHVGFNDYPVGLHVSRPHALTFLVTAMGYVHVYDVESGVRLGVERVATSRVIACAPCSNLPGVVLLHEGCRTTTVRINDEFLVQHLLSQNIAETQVLLRIAERNVDWKLFFKHFIEIASQRQDEAIAYLQSEWCELDTIQPIEDTGRLAARLLTMDGSPGVSHTAALTLRGILLFLMGLLPDSKRYARLALQTDPDDRQARMLLWRCEDVIACEAAGNEALQAADYGTAAQVYTTALDKIGDAKDEGFGGIIRASVLAQRAYAHAMAGQNKLAIADACTSLEILPKQWMAFHARANAHNQQQTLDRAAQDLSAAMKHCDDMTLKLKIQRELDETQRKMRLPTGSAPPHLGGAVVTAAALSGIRSVFTKSPVQHKDYYRLLNVTRNASESEIRQAYRHRSLQHHPRNGGNTETFKLLTEAHQVLANAASRRLYDTGYVAAV